MNRPIRTVVVVIVVGVVASAVYGWYLSDRKSAPGQDLVLYGNVDIREVRLAFNGSEHVGELLVDEGDQVQSGQLVARLHTERLQAGRERARAEVAAIEAEAHAAALTYKRIKVMAERKLASAEEADEAEGKSRAATARVAAAEAVLAEAEQALNDADLHAPVGGVIRERIVELGDFVTPQTPVYTLALLNPVWVRAYLPESYLGRVKPGVPARITTDSFPDKVYAGWVGSVSPTAEFTPKNVETPELRTRLVYQVRVFACNPQFQLRLGMPATVSIDLDAAAPGDTQAEPRCAESSLEPGQQ